MQEKELIYIAGRFEAAPRLRWYRDELLREGFRVSSSWLEEKPGSEPTEMAEKDLREVRECDLLILDTFDSDDRGGREVEFGIALGLKKPIWLVGPVRNIFHNLASQQYKNWGDLLQVVSR